MKRIDIKLSLPVVAPLLDAMREVAGALGGSLAAPMRIQDIDAEFREYWHEELLMGQNAEIALLLGLFDDEFFATGTIALDASNAMPVLRGAAALRLGLRSQKLRLLSDEVLEGGRVSPEVLPESQRNAFMAYVFLATLQELVIQHLGDGILGGAGEAGEDEEA